MKYVVKAFKNKGIKQKDVIRDLGIPQSYASALMNGKKDIGKDMARRLHELYGFDESALITNREVDSKDVSSSDIVLLKELIRSKDETIETMRERIEDLKARLSSYENQTKDRTA